MVRLTHTALFNTLHNKRIHSCLAKIKNLTRVFLFFVGTCCGVILSITFFSTLRYSHTKFRDDNLLHWSVTKGQLQSQDAEYLKKTYAVNETFYKGEDVIAERLKSTVRVLCLVFTTKETFKKSAEAVKNTWGKRCNTLLFVSNFEDRSVPVEKLVSDEGELKNWELVKAAVKHIYVHYLDTHDWLLRVDDHTFVVVENLRKLLSEYKSSDALYLGCRFKKYIKQGFMSGGAGYVLSREAVVRMVQEGLPQEFCSAKNGGVEDVEMGRCMENLQVVPVDTRDSLGRGRFFPFSPETHLIPDAIKQDSWYWDMIYYPPNMGFECCSDTAISFHGIGHQKMYVMNYLIYHLRPYGISPHAVMNKTNTFIVIK
ncbi:glycoprotein-N-acetylgalactosamine 3-beta-galactosyltransferase 1-like isoform X1 [Homalodisca vitripennis]|uniref:glycoprotein-N-acetylgalactosamine 3-beta-galactosyltransferase 1-like isoform X1 n=1 Tax=Homalodisca vitripennis TaxID=197043 RepID=UPI001EEA1EAF|nr:glycoprotein-N-acetylgalactosamine 3-beta-galactosyltransferase 1-like isoform X1 [Homalodisca vitripennis]